MKDEQYRKIITSKEWKKLRAIKIANNPICEDCLLENRTTIATEVHHITPIQRGKSLKEMKKLAYDYNNLRSLCEKCHQKTHELLLSRGTKMQKELRELEKKRFIETYF